MTREEEIRKATLEVVSGMCQHCSIKEKCKETEGYCTEYDSQECGFVAGVQWADEHPNLESIWHDADKMPNKSLPIIVEIDDDVDPSYDVMSIDGTDEKFWKFLVSDRDMTRWAYIKDLLPKTK